MPSYIRRLLWTLSLGAAALSGIHWVQVDCSVVPGLSLQPLQRYTNIAQIRVDSVVADDSPVSAVNIAVTSDVTGSTATFQAQLQGELDSGCAPAVDGGPSLDGGFVDGGSPDPGGGTTVDGGNPPGSGPDGGDVDGGTAAPPRVSTTLWSGLINLAQGANTLRAQATDQLGRQAQGMPQVVVLDSIPPDVIVTSPVSGQAVGANFGVSVHISDATATTVMVDSPGASATATPDELGNLQAPATFLDAGTASIVVTATDSARNSTQVTVQVLADLEAPVVTTQLVDNQAFGPLSGNPFVWTLWVQDVAATTVAFGSGSSGGVSLPRGGGAASAPFALTEGTNTLLARVTSETGKTAQLSRMLVYDTRPPTGSVLVPQPRARVRGAVVVTVSAQDSTTGVASASLRVDGRLGVAGTASGNGLWTWPVDTKTLRNGIHLLNVSLTDGVGNTASLARDFIVRNGEGEIEAGRSDN